MQSFDIEKRVQQAIAYFNEGYNCAQSVFMAYADLFDYDPEAAKAISSSFGGGIGQLHETCGTVSAIAMLTGLRYPVSDPTDLTAKKINNNITRNTIQHFTDNFGSIKCGELLKRLPEMTSSPSAFTPKYETKRPCGRFVEHAARLAGEMLDKWRIESLSLSTFHSQL